VLNLQCKLLNKFTRRLLNFLVILVRFIKTNSLHLKLNFGTKLATRFLLTSYLSRFYGEYLPGGSSVCVQQTAQFIKPYFIGDKIKFHGQVINKIDSTRCLEIEIKAYRDQELIFKGLGMVQVQFD